VVLTGILSIGWALRFRRLREQLHLPTLPLSSAWSRVRRTGGLDLPAKPAPVQLAGCAIMLLDAHGNRRAVSQMGLSRRQIPLVWRLLVRLGAIALLTGCNHPGIGGRPLTEVVRQTLMRSPSSRRNALVGVIPGIRHAGAFHASPPAETTPTAGSDLPVPDQLSPRCRALPAFRPRWRYPSLSARFKSIRN
jgi:hypothetical protein